MLRESLRLALSVLLVACTIPLLAVSFLIAALCAALAVILPGLLRHGNDKAPALEKLRMIDEFGFEGALGAYEELIDAHVRRPL